MGTYAMTGGATGIGAAITSRLQTEGHAVIVIDIKNADIAADLSSRAGREYANTELAKKTADGLDGHTAYGDGKLALTRWMRKKKLR